MTIDLYTEHDILQPEEIPDEYWVARMRNARNQLLAGCDWRMVSDATWDVEAWRTYRQALRDFPATWSPAQIVEFPEAPL